MVHRLVESLQIRVKKTFQIELPRFLLYIGHHIHTIVQPGVLVGLNSLLEQDGSITLPTGEVITRHPDAVIVVTTNITYEGCRGLNQSVIDRMSLVRDVELPSAEVMAQRAMSVTGASDEILISQMVQVVNDLSEY